MEEVKYILKTDEEKINYLKEIGVRPDELAKKNPVFFRNLLGRIHQANYGPNIMNSNNYFFASDQELYRKTHFSKDEEKPVKVEINARDLEKLKSKRVRKTSKRSK